ncbi:hypothetical protein ACFQ9X_20565 [Catenulispora yoronensis]
MADARASLREHATSATKTVADKVTDVASGLVHKIHGPGEEEPAVAAINSTSVLPGTATGGYPSV